MMNAIAGKRFLIAEDDQMIGILLATLLTDQGAETCDRVVTLTEAQEKIAANTYDAALFDIRLGSELSFPAAEQAQEFGVPILFTSGYGQFTCPERLVNAPVLPKPYLVADAIEKISALFDDKSKNNN